MNTTDSPRTGSTAETSPERSRRWVLWAVVGLVVAAGLLLAFAPSGAEKISGRSLGAVLNEVRGNTDFERYDTASELPANDAPSWLPDDASDIQVVRPGSNSEEDGVRLDATVTTTAIPTECTPADGPTSIPWDGAGDWPDLTTATTYTCDTWTMTVDGTHWYLWT